MYVVSISDGCSAQAGQRDCPDETCDGDGIEAETTRHHACMHSHCAMVYIATPGY
jgi:hypothetical protein